MEIGCMFRSPVLNCQIQLKISKLELFEVDKEASV